MKVLFNPNKNKKMQQKSNMAKPPPVWRTWRLKEGSIVEYKGVVWELSRNFYTDTVIWNQQYNYYISDDAKRSFPK